MKNKDFRYDHYAKLAKKTGYKSRAAFKLLQMHQTHRIFRPTDIVLDVGCAPGSWMEVAKQYVTTLTGVDILPMTPIAGCNILQSCFTAVDFTPFSLIISDMCPNKTGIRCVDEELMLDLCTKLVDKITVQRLLCKFFDSSVTKTFEKHLNGKFRTIKKIKPDSSRSCSSELYYWCC